MGLQATFFGLSFFSVGLSSCVRSRTHDSVSTSLANETSCVNGSLAFELIPQHVNERALDQINTDWHVGVSKHDARQMQLR